MSYQSFFSRGKLMITGEYMVMEGALSLALPLKQGQTMLVKQLHDTDNKLYWNSYYDNKLWFSAIYDKKHVAIIESNDKGKAMYIQQILFHALKTNATIQSQNNSIEINNYLDFSPEWGFGSSSSLISNVAFWIDTEPFSFFRQVAVGSGYDIACARANSPIVYQLQPNLPIIQEVVFKPSFRKNIHFVYLGKKQQSASSLAKYRIKLQENSFLAEKISQITKNILNVENIETFNENIEEHEKIISQAIGEPTLKSTYFNNFNGSIKSLGAWGGDFMMISSKQNKTELKNYFYSKGLKTIFNFDDIIL